MVRNHGGNGEGGVGEWRRGGGVTIAESYYLLAMPNSLISCSQAEEGILHTRA
jgi:hypothetical protein